MSTKQITMVGLGAALMAVFAQISIPIPNVPLTFQLFGVVLLGVMLPRKLSTLALTVYVLIGAVGAPVFAGFSGGLQALIGPTGGYLYSFIASAFIVGTFAKKNNMIYTTIGAYLGLAVSYIVGTIQLKYVLDMSWLAAISSGTGGGVFLIKDIVFTGIAIIVGKQIHQILLKNGLLNNKITE
ncbi:biotin transporter BioY [Candidatus Epulonipiscium viviparus]|uniref:biotin transporter BioY n=1 Tax=Candidatus Epulonipiscium viviparus TaxID=420336 RepID=UPI00273807D8|nr:biotin transporter BioY [Candidatus Epulopiscium viviparus]